MDVKYLSMLLLIILILLFVIYYKSPIYTDLIK